MADEYPPILTSEQVAEMLSMNVQMVRLAAREGRLPAYRLPGGRALLKVEGVHRFSWPAGRWCGCKPSLCVRRRDV
jgi:excisionase family DNA binding protein